MLVIRTPKIFALTLALGLATGCSWPFAPSTPDVPADQRADQTERQLEQRQQRDPQNLDLPPPPSPDMPTMGGGPGLP